MVLFSSGGRKDSLRNIEASGEFTCSLVTHALVKDGRVDTGAMRLVSRLGYMDYGVLEPADVFTLNRPLTSDNGRSVRPPPADWDGIYR